MYKDFKELKQNIEKQLSCFGSIELDEKISTDVYLAYDIWLNIDSKNPSLNCIEVYINLEGGYILGKRCTGILIDELKGLQQFLAIFHGSPFTLVLECVDNRKLRYSVEIPDMEIDLFPQLLKYMSLLKILLTKVSKEVNIV